MLCFADDDFRMFLFCFLQRHGLWKDAVDIDADFALAEDKIASSTQTPADSPVFIILVICHF